MSDLGAPSSYLLLKPGVAVVASDDVHVGTVSRVLADPEIDIFDGIVVSTVDGERLVAGARSTRSTTTASSSHRRGRRGRAVAPALTPVTLPREAAVGAGGSGLVGRPSGTGTSL